MYDGHINGLIAVSWSNPKKKNAASESPHHDLGPLGGRFLELSENHHVSW
jgi:hypothetical protein